MLHSYIHYFDEVDNFSRFKDFVILSKELEYIRSRIKNEISKLLKEWETLLYWKINMMDPKCPSDIV